jgi:lysophospholipase L1-like esterase
MKLWLFRGIALSLPVLFFLLLEYGLRWAGLHQSWPLFIPNPAAPDYLLTRPDVIKRYFPSGSAIPNVTVEPAFFLKTKADNALRLVVQGESTTAGYPYGLGASLAGMLDQRLKRTFPQRKVEVINTAMSAVNSFALLDFADEIIAQQPDAVLIYVGHNEYLGVLGVGSSYSSSNSAAFNLLYMKLRRLATFQTAQDLYQQWQLPAEQNTTGRTLMAKVAQGQHIAFDSDLYHAGLQQFKQNMSLLLDKYQQAGIAVYIATIASNIADQPPFVSEALTAQQQQMLSQIQQQQVRQQLEQMAEQQHHAALSYELGQYYRKAQQKTEALLWLTKAKDYDQLRFRAPSAINQQIRQLATDYGAVLVDVEQTFMRQSVQGLVGKSLMLEHLHPNVQGYFLLADSFYQQLKQQQLGGPWQRVIDPQVAWAQRPLLPAEEFAGAARILQLTSDYPFVQQPQSLVLPQAKDWQQQLGLDYFHGKISWVKMLELSYQGYQQRKDKAMLLKTTLILADALPQHRQLNTLAAAMLQQQNRAAEAAFYQHRVVLATPR